MFLYGSYKKGERPGTAAAPGESGAGLRFSLRGGVRSPPSKLGIVAGPMSPEELGLKTASSGVSAAGKHLKHSCGFRAERCRVATGADAPRGVASPHGLHRQDFAGKDVLVVINNSFLGNEKCKFFTNKCPTKGIISYFIPAR